MQECTEAVTDGTAVLFGCAVPPPAFGVYAAIRYGDGGSTGVELMYWPSPNAQEVELADTMVMRWNRLHPGIHVRMQPIPVSQSSEEVLLAAIAGKTTPDICSNIWPGALRDYTDAGGLIALDGFADFDSALGSACRAISWKRSARPTDTSTSSRGRPIR